MFDQEVIKASKLEVYLLAPKTNIDFPILMNSCTRDGHGKREQLAA